ncbi:MAG: adenylate kinase [Chlamydiae bacterium RIFCSPHIGHO2_12_FULL_44_59]|nr:MAG: adenylate kinase [Chlamydiae bacterium RIFCSPHIGHO2_02_FULL_45_9]OGN56851.1 MAG: adenylate kinase [Chlamydiae bacterium RIFCSPHIGHO2_01_FULL_44_39]OGN59509.1 MAG: adenylate kinase [Chlamydiae bacterium RIFCSPHIGHO2_12_FULL_44_59]OGN67254.1 MAG: adenylate kinase [Chlamydiae bacterium RIFCSPLOWO2_01_FULL_44_52]OGN68676.1 MAG: adenylate kinase [Chlamydiae bacterium RIFCSPLOWO2_02_FULL_45_22]OGN69197.1 MAG: adenylate kinase [Chlamydiae bacterium RIFCSPLOWO2_12_FULL_45_20]
MSSSLDAEQPFALPISEVVVLLGPPGSGKGTHALELSKELQIPHISTGDLFREAVRAQTILGLQAKTFMDLGHLVPDDLVTGMVCERITRPDCKSGYILDGFPRTILQAKALLKDPIVLHFVLDEETIIERILGRIMCKTCNRPYHQLFDPPEKEMTCNTCLKPLCRREDDQRDVILHRLHVYRQQTEPLIDFYRSGGGLLIEIDSKPEKSVVFSRCLEALGFSAIL